MTEKLPDTPAIPVSFLRKEFGRKRKRRLYNPDKRELFMEFPEKPNEEICNCEEEYIRKPIEERRPVLNITNIEFSTGLDTESTSTPISFHSLYEVSDYNDKDKSEESRLRRSLRLRQSKVLIPVLYVSDRDVVMMEDISEVEKHNRILNVSPLRVNKTSSVSEANTNNTNTIEFAVLSDTKNFVSGTL